MGACAWVLGLGGRLPGRDAWATVGGEMPLGRGAEDVAVFWAGQNCSDWQSSARGEHCKSITCVHGHLRVQMDETNIR